MTKKEDLFYDSRDNRTKIHAICWIPESAPIRGILQIAHGMMEYIDRYDDFARNLSEAGYVVAGNDHLGHGDSVSKEEDRGFFCDKGGDRILIEDMHELMNIMKKRYPSVPYFMLGHSMGSFLVRRYITIYGKEIQGAVIVGTGCQPYILVKTGELLTGLIASVKGWRYRSRFINNLAIGGYNRRFEPVKTPFDWLTRDERVVEAYRKDPRTDFIFTLNAYYHMFRGMSQLYRKKNLERMPKDLPVIFLSGDEDPVGDFGKGVLRAYESFRKSGMKNVSIKLYKGSRHEIINELDRETVYKDITEWMNQCRNRSI